MGASTVMTHKTSVAAGRQAAPRHNLQRRSPAGLGGIASLIPFCFISPFPLYLVLPQLPANACRVSSPAALTTAASRRADQSWEETDTARGQRARVFDDAQGKQQQQVSWTLGAGRGREGGRMRGSWGPTQSSYPIPHSCGLPASGTSRIPCSLFVQFGLPLRACPLFNLPLLCEENVSTRW